VSVFIEGLREYLLDVGRGARPSIVLADTDRHWAHYLRRLGERGGTREEVKKTLDRWTRADFDELMQQACARLTKSIAYGASEAELRDWIDRVIDRAMNVDVPGLTALQDVLLDEAAELWQWKRVGPRPINVTPDFARYALELRLIRRRGVETVRSPVGEAWLATPGADAARLLMALEVEQATGPLDDFRLSESGARWLAMKSKGWLDSDPDGPPWELAWSSFERLRDLGLLTLDDERDDPSGMTTRFELTLLGRTILSEMARGEPDAFRVVARALIDDERGASIGALVPAFEKAQRAHASEASARETRLVAHEIRNALVPVRLQLDRLYGALERTPMGLDLTQYRGPIDRGLARVFAFVDARLKMAHVISEAALFAIDEAVGEAGYEIAGEGPPMTLVHELGATGAYVRGPRPELIGVLTELVRNARLAVPGRPLVVHVGTRTGGTSVVVDVDDDGPGVPAQVAEHAFERGFSTRGGSGQGLALTKEIVEGAFRGTVTLTQSPMGGARITLTLPLASEPQNR